jgi:hypothetical protein
MTPLKMSPAPIGELAILQALYATNILRKSIDGSLLFIPDRRTQRELTRQPTSPALILRIAGGTTKPLEPAYPSAS